jgi:hypothetical protein
MKFVLIAGLALLSAFGRADTEYLGLYLNGSKIGYSSFSSSNVTLSGKRMTRSDSKSVMDASLLGTPVSIEMYASTLADSNGKPVKMSFTTSSGGRSQVVDATFGTKTVAISIDNSGQKSTRTLSLPSGSIVDDPVALVVAGKLKPGTTRTVYVLDPMTIAFLKNDVKVVGPTKIIVNGKTNQTTLLEVTDPRTVTKIYLTAKGAIVRIDAALGIVMLPVSKAVALAPPGEYAPTKDLAFATSLKASKPIEDPTSLRSLRIRFEAKNVKSIPSGDFQTASKTGDSWIVEIHPPKILPGGSIPITQAAKEKPDWVKASLDIPSRSPTFVNLAKKIVGQETDVDSASLLIQHWVHSQMKPNAGIGVLRDAGEVLKTKEGVCRDYAILTVTLLRAAGIPARLASGIVNWDGSFYYHAWAEAWDGARWIGLDSTQDLDQISAAHVKLGEGNVDQAFVFSLLDAAKIEILDMSSK